MISLFLIICVASVCRAEESFEYTSLELAILQDIDAGFTTKPVQGQECELDSTESGVCVKKSLCVTSTHRSVDPVLSFTLRSLTSRDMKAAGTKATSDESSDGTCGWMEVCCPVSKVYTPKMKPPPPALGCGYGNPGATSIRSSSSRATSAFYADFPWMVALMVKSNLPSPTFADEYIGGGTIIHPSIVMTVAHKVFNLTANMLKCRAGEWNWALNNELYKYQDRDVSKIIVNENFDKDHVRYNIALLQLKSAYDLTNAPHIGVACLEKTMPATGTLCYSMGWGKNIATNEENVKVLKKIALPIVDRDECQSIYRASSLSNRYVLHKTFLCAGGEEGIDTCLKDGGSPLVCPIPDKYNLRYSVVGMVTYGLACGGANKPGVYANVPEMYNWIQSQMEMTLKLDYHTYVY